MLGREEKGMNLQIGTSGFGYREWRGKFYPAELKPRDMLPFYADRFPVVEINATFYRMPSPSVLETWAAQVPKSFIFTFKAPGLITHRKRLRDAEAETAAFLSKLTILGAQLGPALFQLPPSFPCDLPRLRQFLDGLAVGRFAFEFRHPSWLVDEVYALLQERSCALCLSDRDGAPSPSMVATADFGYVRLRRSQYTDEELRSWQQRISGQGWQEVFVFFRHEETARGPAYAQKLLAFSRR
jgi:uncharacterized protein YecE (DUF72 family)